MEKHVNFFNIMSYDLHGAWDRDNKWLGPYLFAHTNLTEIQDAMGLLWRNEIPSKKVIMGTAFYGRAFTGTSTSCMEPGCTFESAGNKGLCSRENGILLNGEIVDIIDEKGLTPTLYKEAGVKVAHWDNQWVAYDDEDTLKLKVDFALGLGLGGVMVWAVSHDTPTRQFSNAFSARAANRHGMILKIIDSHHDQVQVRKTIDQCKWTNCGDGCPKGYQPTTRIDKSKHSKCELMMNSTACENDLHILCCPETRCRREAGTSTPTASATTPAQTAQSRWAAPTAAVTVATRPRVAAWAPARKRCPVRTCTKAACGPVSPATVTPTVPF